MKVSGSISSKGVSGTITQKGVKGSVSQKGVTGSVVESGFDWAVYWASRYPSALLLTVDSSTQITLNWTNNGSLSSSDSILIYESTDGVTYTLINTALYSVSSYIRTGLTASTLYYYKIRYTRGGTYSAYCTPATATTSTSTSYPIVIEDGNTVAWYLADDLTTITKDGSNFVSRWNDKLASGHDLIQVAGTNQPLWQSNGVLFDGVDNFMQTSNFTLNQPTFIYIVFKNITYMPWRYFFDGTQGSGLLAGITTSPNVQAYANTFSTANSNLTIDNFHVVRLLFNGANSKLIVNDTTPTTGNFGTGNMGGLYLGRGKSAGTYTNIQVKEIILRNVADDSTNETAIYNYLKTKYGL